MVGLEAELDRRTLALAFEEADVRILAAFVRQPFKLMRDETRVLLPSLGQTGHRRKRDCTPHLELERSLGLRGRAVAPDPRAVAPQAGDGS